MKWLTLAAIVVLPPTAILASRMPHPTPAAPLPRLIQDQAPRTRGPLLGVLMVGAAPKGREE